MEKRFTFFTLVAFLMVLSNLNASNVETSPFNNTDFFSTSDDHFSFLSDTLVNIEDTVYVQTANCTAGGKVTIDIPISDIFNFQLTDNGNPYTGGIAPSNIDTLSTYNIENLQTEGPYVLQSWMVNGKYFRRRFSSCRTVVRFYECLGSDWQLGH